MSLCDRPCEDGAPLPAGRGVLSMNALSHGVIRVDSEDKLSALTVQDVGNVIPGGRCDVDECCSTNRVMNYQTCEFGS